MDKLNAFFLDFIKNKGSNVALGTLEHYKKQLSKFAKHCF